LQCANAIRAALRKELQQPREELRRISEELQQIQKGIAAAWEKSQPPREELQRIRKELQQIQEGIVDIKAELLHATQETQRDPKDPRKDFIAGIIMSGPPLTKMTAEEIFCEADRLQQLNPKIPYYKPVPEWKVDKWVDMAKANKAQKLVSLIRADPRYLPYKYLTKKGKRLATYRSAGG
jgi:hypothetical protein